MTLNRRNTQVSAVSFLFLSLSQGDGSLHFLPKLTGGLKTHFVFLAEKLNELYIFMLF